MNITLEKHLATHIKKMCDVYYGCTQIQVRKIASELAISNNIQFKGPILGPKWLKGFLKRHNLCSRVSQDISIDRAKGMSPQALNIYFDLLKEAMCYVKSPDRIFNVDETGISTVAKKRFKVVAERGTKRVQAIASSERGTLTTVILGMSASGQHIPPLVVYPNKKAPTDVIVPDGTIFEYSTKKRGWSNTEIFSRYIDHFIKYTSPSKTDPVLLILDNHTSHMALEIAEKCNNNNIIVLTLPPHTSHYAQPLDVSFMSPFKLQFGKEEKLWMSANVGTKVWLPEVLSFMNIAYRKVTSNKLLAQNAFKACGIIPFNRNIFDTKIIVENELNLDVLSNVPTFNGLNIFSNKRLGKSTLVTGNLSSRFQLLNNKMSLKLTKCNYLFSKDTLCKKTVNLLKRLNIKY